MIEIGGLEKSFGRLEVLRGVDLNVPSGRITALVGPNGSGKTTLIQCVLGLVRPDAGWIQVGEKVLDEGYDYRRGIGYMPQAAPFPDNLSAGEVLDMLRDIRGGEMAPDEDLIERFDLKPELDKPLRTLSGGTRQKVNAVIAFLFRPPLIILDEPTAGLDPIASRALKDKILAERESGRTFVITSHIMSELEELAEYVSFIIEGRIRFSGKAEDLKADTGETTLERAVASMMRSGLNPAGDAEPAR
jgi:Cu-processing system ATP-binding protein